MEIRRSRSEDLSVILALYGSARDFMRKSGNMTQWEGIDAPETRAAADIAEGRSFVCCEGDGILAVFAFEPEADDPTYREITDGAWPDDGPYGVLHRIAVGAPGRDVAGFCLDWCAARCRQLRADTHESNLAMQRALKKNGFRRCGIIRVSDGSERIAFARPATVWIPQDEKRRRKLIWICGALYALALLLALVLIGDILRATGTGLLWLVPVTILIALPGVLTIAPRLRSGGGVGVGPDGLDHHLAEPALHGTFPWSDFCSAAFDRRQRELELELRDPDAFFDALPKRTRRTLRQRRIRSNVLPLPCLLLTKPDRLRLARLVCNYLDVNNKLK